MNNTTDKFKIGDIVEFGSNSANSSTFVVQGTGELLAMVYDLVVAQSWIVLIKERHTDDLKKIPEKALLILNTQMRKIW